MDQSAWIYHVGVERVVDGDTLDLNIDLGWSISIERRVRLRRIDTHEVWGVPKESDEYAKGEREADFVRRVVDEADEIMLRSYRTGRQGKYGRYVADIQVDGELLSDLLVEEFDELELREDPS